MAFGWHHGTGVLPVYFIVVFMRGVTVAVIGTSSLLISQRTGLPQNTLVAARGVGLILGPSIFGRLIGQVVWSGNSQYGTAALLATKALCAAIIPRSANAVILYPAFFILGLSMTVLDTARKVLVTRVYQDSCTLPLNIYETIYGLGAMITPYFVVSAPELAWDILFFVDLSLAVYVFAKRLIFGKPTAWKVRVRFPQSASSRCSDLEMLRPVEPRHVPGRIVVAGIASLFVAQACETAVSAWAFTFATSNLGMHPKIAALAPTSFYMAFTLMRLLVLLASNRMSPSTIVHCATGLTLTGTLMLHAIASAKISGALAPCFLLCMAIIGAGVCPLYAMILASMQRHGVLTAQQLGMYQTASALGNTLGLWLPGLISLPKAERAWAICLFFILNSNRSGFPWCPADEQLSAKAARQESMCLKHRNLAGAGA